MSCCPVASFVRLLRLASCLSIMAASSKFVTDAIKGCVHVCGDGKKKHEIQSRSVAEHDATFPEHIFFLLLFWGVTFQSIVLKLSGIMYITLLLTNPKQIS